MAQQGIGIVKQILPYSGKAGQARRRKIEGNRWRGTLIHALEKRLKERERENHSRGDRPL